LAASVVASMAPAQHREDADLSAVVNQFGIVPKSTTRPLNTTPDYRLNTTGGTAVDLTEQQVERLDDAIDTAMLMHESVANDSRCSCGARNNMDGDVLHAHRVGMVTYAVHHALGLT
jgi:hypothetical protein